MGIAEASRAPQMREVIVKSTDGAWSKILIKHAHKKEDDPNVWVTALIERRGKNKATVALANKLTRIGWAVVRTGEPDKENYAV